MPPNNPNRNGQQLDANLRKAVGSARQLSFAMTGVSSGISGAANAAGQLAEQFALVSRNAKMVAGATGIGAIVTVLGGLATVWKTATDQMKDFNATMNRLASDTKIAQLQGLGPARDLQARKEAILSASEQELEQARKIKNEEERRVVLAAIYKRTREQTAAVDREAARSRNRSYGDQRAELGDDIEMMEMTARSSGIGPQRQMRLLGTLAARQRRDADLRKLDQNDANLNDAQLVAMRELITARYESEMRVLEADLQRMALQIGDTFASSLVDAISDGIVTAISTGNIGEGFRAMTGGILIGMGNMLQQVGMQALLAAQLMKGIMDALTSFAPAGAIGPAIALIALGAVLKGLGASMGGRGGGGGATYGGRVPSNTSYVGVANPVTPNTAGLRPVTPVTVQATFIGRHDPTAQRELLEMINLARARGSARG